MKLQFSLLRSGSSEATIYLWVWDSRFTGRKFKYSTRQRINAKQWDADDERVRIKNSLPPQEKARLLKINQHLDQLAETVKDFAADKLNSKTLSKEDLHNYIDDQKKDDRRNEEERAKKESDFFKVWQAIIDSTKGKTGERVTSGTKGSKTQTLNLVNSFCLSAGVKPSFESIDMTFYHQLDQYMETRGLNPNSRGKHFKEIKAVLREAQDRDIPVNPSFMKKSFRVIRKESDSIYLGEPDLRKLVDTEDLTAGERRLCDLFLVACYVGARHSDWHQITSDNIVRENGREILKYLQTKTREIIHVPVHPVVKMMLAKYKGSLPKVISNQKYNEALKSICEKAKLKAFERVTTHTARRSFATNAYLSRSMDVHSIMKCTGHRSESSFLRYLKLKGLDFAVQASDAKFFNDNSLVSKLKIA